MKKLLLKQIFVLVLLTSSRLLGENSVEQSQELNIDIVAEINQIFKDIWTSCKKHLADFDTQSLHDDMPNPSSAAQENKNDAFNQAAPIGQPTTLKPKENIGSEDQLIFNNQSWLDSGILPTIETDQMLSQEAGLKEFKPALTAPQEPSSLSNDGIKQDILHSVQASDDQNNTLVNIMNTEKHSILDTIQKAGVITVEAAMITCISYALLNYMINKLPKTSKLALKKRMICCAAAALACAGSIVLQSQGYAAQNILR